MAVLLIAGLLLYLSVMLLILGCIAAGKKLSHDRLPASDIWFMSLACFVIGGSLLIMAR